MKTRFIFINIILILMCTIAVKAEMLNLSLSYDGKVHNYSAESVYLVVNGNKITGMPMPPIILDGRTLIPAREVFEPIGAVVDWNNNTREVYISYRNDLVVLQIDNKYANVNGQKIEMQIPPKIINNKTMIPIRFAAESLGLSVDWSNKERIVSVGTSEYLATLQNTEQTKSPSNTASNSTEINIHSITPPTSSDSNFRINADGEIGKIETFVLTENRLVLDVYNARMNLAQQTITVTHPFVTAVRVAQNQVEPEPITRIVFDLTTNTDAAVSLSDDKNSIVVSFEENTVNTIDFHSDGTNDYLNITADAPFKPNIFQLSSPERLVIDIPASRLGIPERPFERGRFASAVRYSVFEQSTVRIVLDLDGEISYAETADGNTLTLKISEPTYRNIYYSSENGQIVLNKAAGLTAYNLTHSEQLLNSKYVISLNSNFESFYGYGAMRISDNHFETIHIQTTAGNTQLIFNENQILSYTSYEDENCLYINFVKPKEKYGKIVVLDAGHGGKDNGASGHGLIEKNLTLDIVMKTKALLEQNGSFKVYTTRDTDVYPTLDERPELANKVGDVFVSVHINSSGTNSKAQGTEVHYLKDNTKGNLTSSILSETLQRNLVNELSSVDRKTKVSDFKILRQSNIPSALIELGFISNSEEAAKMGSNEYRQKAALAIYNSLIEIFENYSVR